MATVHLDDDLYRQLASRATAQGRSVEADVHRILEGHASDSDSEGERRWRALDRMIARVQESPWALPEEGEVNSTELIRQMREEEEAHLERVVRGEP